jgi:dUTP diphosphatase
MSMGDPLAPPCRVAFRRLANGADLAMPRQATAGAAAMDLRAAIGSGAPLTIAPGQRAAIGCGFALALPEGFEGQVRPRSGLALKFGVTVLNAPGTIDADYRGEIKVVLINFGESVFEIKRGDRIAQLLVAPVQAVILVEADELDQTARGEKGHGSTGRE